MDASSELNIGVTRDGLTEDGWHYTHRGTKHGPVSANEIKSLYSDGTITDETLVWAKKYGTSWVKLFDVHDQIFGSDDGAPPLPVSDHWIWFIAAVPVIGLVAELLLQTFGNLNIGQSALLALYNVSYLILVLLDCAAVRRAGRHDLNKIIWALFMVVPVYVFIRNRRLRKKQWPLAGWALAFVASVAFTTDELRAGMGLGIAVSLPSCGEGNSIAQIKTMFPEIPLNFGSLPAFELNDIRTVSVTEAMNTCTATVVSAGRQEFLVQYTIEDRGGEYYYYLNLKF